MREQYHNMSIMFHTVHYSDNLEITNLFIASSFAVLPTTLAIIRDELKTEWD